jgi:AraC-like DNA-binding protein
MSYSLPTVGRVTLADSRHRRLRRPVGVLWPDVGEDVFDTGHLPVADPASLVVSHYWWVRWRRPQAMPVRPQVLSHPVCHLTVEDAKGGQIHGLPAPACLVHGLVKRVFAVELPVAGRVAGIAFHPGGLAALLDTDVRGLTGRIVPATDVLGPDVVSLARQVLAERDEGGRHQLFVGYVEAALASSMDRVRGDAGYRTVRRAVELMRAREHVTLTPVAERLRISPRTLQRLFARYVGASPLWVLRRYRLQDAAAAIDAGEGADLAGLAADLGFADQAHFTRSFTQVIGVPPSIYRQGHGGPVQ